MNLIYNINNPRALNLGQQYDHNVRTITFTGFTPVDEANTVYLKYEGVGLYPLMNMSFQVSQSFTLKDGTFNGQLLEVDGNGDLIQNSIMFKMMVKPSLAEETEIVENDPSISLWFTEMSELYQTVLQAYEDGTLVTKENVTAALGYTPANEEDIPVVPTNVSEFNNDAGYISGITDTDIAAALGYTPANEADIPTVPTNVSEFNNDAGYISGIVKSDVTNALGYTPAKNNVRDLFASEWRRNQPYTGQADVVLNGDNLYVNSHPDDGTEMSSYYFDTSDWDQTTVEGLYKKLRSRDLSFQQADMLKIADQYELKSYHVGDMVVINDNSSRETEDRWQLRRCKVEIPTWENYDPSHWEDTTVSSAIRKNIDAALHSRYELINTINVESSTASIVRSIDDVGNEYNLASVMVIIRNQSGIGSGANSYMFAYDMNDEPVGGTQVYFYAPTNAIQAAVGVEINGAVVKMESTGWTGAAVYSPVIKTLISDLGNSNGIIKKVEINSNGGVFSAGTTINIYGVRI